MVEAWAYHAVSDMVGADAVVDFWCELVIELAGGGHHDFFTLDCQFGEASVFREPDCDRLDPVRLLGCLIIFEAFV